MNATTTLYDDRHVLEIEHTTKSSKENPHGPWTIRGTIRIKMTGFTLADAEREFSKSLKISRQRCRQTMTRDDAVKYLGETVLWTDVGKGVTKVTPERGRAAIRAEMEKMSKEERLAYLKKQFGDLME